MSDSPQLINMEDDYKTRVGYPARIVCTNRRHPKFPVCALVLHNNGEEVIYAYTATGSYFEGGEEDPRDLVLDKPTVEPATTKEHAMSEELELKLQPMPPTRKHIIKITYNSDVHTAAVLDLATSFLRLGKDGDSALLIRESDNVDISLVITRVSPGKFDETWLYVNKQIKEASK